MTEEDIKEALSNNYVSTLANRRGFKLLKAEKDKGVDFTIKYDIKRELPKGGYAEIDSPYSCDLQMKSTTVNSITYEKDHIIYDLRAKNYNDLVYRKMLGFTPLVLILFILPENKDEWVKVLKDELIISKNAFWYYPSDDENEQVKNKSKKRIKIPIKNKLDFSFFEIQIKKWIPEWMSMV